MKAKIKYKPLTPCLEWQFNFSSYYFLDTFSSPYWNLAVAFLLTFEFCWSALTFVVGCFQVRVVVGVVVASPGSGFLFPCLFHSVLTACLIGFGRVGSFLGGMSFLIPCAVISPDGTSLRRGGFLQKGRRWGGQLCTDYFAITSNLRVFCFPRCGFACLVGLAVNSQRDLYRPHFANRWDIVEVDL